MEPIGLDRGLRDRLHRLGQEFLARFLSAQVERHPQDVGALADLATLLTELGQLEEGLAVDRRLVELEPENPTVHYNLACSHALLGQTAPALEALEASIGFGYDDLEHLEADEDLASLRDHPGFEALLHRLRARAKSSP